MSINEFENKPADETVAVEAVLSEGGAKSGSSKVKAVAAPKSAKKAEGWIETFQTIGIALVIALFVRSFLFQPFNIPSESMKPTLLVGDFLFVSKFEYGYSKNSLPFSLPLIPGPGRLFFHAPHRGDVVVFKTPSDNRTDYIKRLIGLPGDRIQVKEGVLYVNGAAVLRTALGPYQSKDPRNGGETTGTLYQETLPNGVSYKTLDLGETRADNTREFVVPAGHYFMMGDNRDNSTDSRFSTSVGGVGYVPAINLVGKAEILFFSVHAPHPIWAIWRWPLSIRYGRLFHLID